MRCAGLQCLASPGDTHGITYADTLTSRWFATARGRVGYAAGNVLVYFTSGGAWTNLRVQHQGLEIGFGGTCNASGGNYCDAGTADAKTGWTIGGGAGWALSNNWSLEGEYLYADFGSVNYASALIDNGARVVIGGVPQSIAPSVDFNMQVVRAGINYKF